MITADELYLLYRPSPCKRRLFLQLHRPELAAPPSEYDQLLMGLGLERERAHLAAFPEAVRPEYPVGNLQAGAQATRALIEQNSPVVYQGVLCSPGGEVAGIPDFLIREGTSYVIRDVKLAVNLDKHPEIPAQLSLYARAFGGSFGKAPSSVEVVLGDSTVVKVPTVPLGEVLREIGRLKQARQEPDEAVGWSKCTQCTFGQHCWQEAERRCDPGVVYGVEQGLRNTLVQSGIKTYHELAEMPADVLAELRYPRGRGERRVGTKTAVRIQRQARVLVSGVHEVFGMPEFPPEGPTVYFDIESDPHDEGLENRVYLSGVLTDRGE